MGGRTSRASIPVNHKFSLVNHKFSLVNRVFSTDNYVLPLVNHAFPLVNRTFLSVESGTSLCLCEMRHFYFLISDFYIMCILTGHSETISGLPYFTERHLTLERYGHNLGMYWNDKVRTYI